MANTFTVNTYSANDVQLIISGYQITGWENISISRTVKGFSVIRGIRGKNTRVFNIDTSATLMFNLLQTVQSNDVLSEIHDQDRDKGTGRISLTLKDNSGRSVFSSEEAYITGYPATVYSANFEYRQWEIFCQSTGSYLIAGNSRPATALLDSAVSSITSTVSGFL